MAETAEQISVTIEPEVALDDQTKKTDQPRGEDGKFVKSEAAVADLKSQYDELVKKDEAREAIAAADRRRAEQATQEAQRARQEASAARTEATDSQLDTVTSGIAAALAEADTAERDYQSAQEAGDFAKAAKAQRAMSKAEARIVRLEEAKSDIEARKAEAPKRDETRRTEQTEHTDPVEHYIAGRTEPTAKWLREHRDWVLDPKKNAKLTSAHWSAIAEGITADTEEYFEHVETSIGLRKNESTNGAEKPQANKRRSSVVAPVAHPGGGTNGSSGTEVRLTAGEARAATDGTLIWNYDDPSGQKRFRKGDPIGHQEMARRKLEGTKQGLYDRTYVEQ